MPISFELPSKMPSTCNILITGFKHQLCINNDSTYLSVATLKQRIGTVLGFSIEDYYLVQNGQILNGGEDVQLEMRGTTSVNVFPRMLGGKGGFGSLIRAMGKSTQKSQNTEACRDLSGRRIRDVSTEKKLDQWLKESDDRKQQVEEEKRVRREKRRVGPKHVFTDHNYMTQIQANAESIDDALKQGLVASGSSSSKRPSSMEEIPAAKKLHLWSGVDEDLSSDDEETVQLPQASTNGEEEAAAADDTTPNQLSVDGDQPSEEEEDTNSADTAGHQCQAVYHSPSTGQVSTPCSSAPDTQPQVTNTTQPEFEAVDLANYASVEELANGANGEQLKLTLQSLGLKCGGTPLQRAERLFSTKGKSTSELDPSLFAKPKKQKK